jgi:hypothetical protein
MKTQIPFPSVGDKIKFRGVPNIYYPMFTPMKKLAENNLKIGQICIVRKVEVYSSWCGVWLEEIPGEDNYLNLMFFDN